MNAEFRDPTKTAQEAKERVEERLRFLSHFTYYVGLVVLFVVLNYVASASGELTWSLYIAGAWGVFLYLHFLSAFVVADLRGPFRRWLLKREHERSLGPGDGKDAGK